MSYFQTLQEAGEIFFLSEFNDICIHVELIMLSVKVCLFFVVFNVTFNNISVLSWRSVLLVEETRGPRENHRPVASH